MGSQNNYDYWKPDEWWHFWKRKWWNFGENPLLGCLLFVGAIVVVLLLFFTTFAIVGVFPI